MIKKCFWFPVVLILLAISITTCSSKLAFIEEDVLPQEEAGNKAITQEADNNVVIQDMYKQYMEQANQRKDEITIEKDIVEKINSYVGEGKILKNKTRLAFDINDMNNDGVPELIMFKKYYLPNENSLSEEKISTVLELRILAYKNELVEEIFSNIFYDSEDLMGRSPSTCLQYCIEKKTGKKFILQGGITSHSHGDNFFCYSVLECGGIEVAEKEKFRLYEEHAYAYMNDEDALHYYECSGENVSKEVFEHNLTKYDESFYRLDIFNYKINEGTTLVNLLDAGDYNKNYVQLDENQIDKILTLENESLIDVHENPFNSLEINILDEVCGLTLINKKTSAYLGKKFVYQLDFTGEVEVSGTYEIWKEGHLSPCICFEPDKDSVELFPKVNGDGRNIWFTLNNYNDINKKFSEGGSSGKATIVIDNYSIDLNEAATSNKADLIKILGIETNTVKDTIVDRFKKNTKENVVKVFCDDFDADGVKEAFVLTGELTNDKDECSWREGKVWFVNQYKTKLVQEGFFTHFSFEPKIITVDNTKLLYVNKEYATGCHSFLFGVVAEQPCTYFGYQKGYIHKENGKMFLNNDAYDAHHEDKVETFTGHTYKDYYLYFEKAEESNHKRFREYGAIEISLEQFLKFSGAEDMLKQIKASNNNVEITNILYRENNIINLNYNIRDNSGYSQKYVTVNYNDKEVYNFTTGDGKYEKTIIPKIASYPVFKEPKVGG